MRLDTAADLLNLKYLDQKLWVSLSCPTTGIEFDARTLALVDTDADGHIRAPELLAAIDWAAARLSTPDVLGQNKNGVPVAAIKDESLAELARSQCAEGVTLLTPETALAAEAKALEQALTGWDAQGAATREQNATAAAAVEPLRAKIDDFFARCRLAAFDARAGEALNGAGDIFTAMAPDSLATHDARIAALPLAQVGAGRTAPLTGEGINPAWAASMAVFLTDAVTPLLGVRTELTDAEWQQIKARLADYDAWQAILGAWRATFVICCRSPTTLWPFAISTCVTAKPCFRWVRSILTDVRPSCAWPSATLPSMARWRACRACVWCIVNAPVRVKSRPLPPPSRRAIRIS